MLPSQLQDQDEAYIYAASNEYIEEQFYETVAESSVRVRIYLCNKLATYMHALCLPFIITNYLVVYVLAG